MDFTTGKKKKERKQFKLRASKSNQYLQTILKPSSFNTFYFPNHLLNLFIHICFV